MVADQRYGQLEQVRGWLNAAAYPAAGRHRLALPRAGAGSPARSPIASRLRQENLALTARPAARRPAAAALRGAQEENRRLREHARSSAGVAERAIVASILQRGPRSRSATACCSTRAAADGVFKGQAVLDADGHLRPGLARQARTSEVDPDHRRGARDAGAVEPQRRAHDRGRHRRPRTGCRCPSSPWSRTCKGVTCCSPRAWAACSRRATRSARSPRSSATSKATFAIVEARPTARAGPRSRSAAGVVRAAARPSQRRDWHGDTGGTRRNRRAAASQPAATSTPGSCTGSVTACRDATARRSDAMSRGTRPAHPLLDLGGARACAVLTRPAAGWLDVVRPTSRCSPSSTGS